MTAAAATPVADVVASAGIVDQLVVSIAAIPAGGAEHASAQLIACHNLTSCSSAVVQRLLASGVIIDLLQLLTETVPAEAGSSDAGGFRHIAARVLSRMTGDLSHGDACEKVLSHALPAYQVSLLRAARGAVQSRRADGLLSPAAETIVLLRALDEDAATPENLWDASCRVELRARLRDARKARETARDAGRWRTGLDAAEVVNADDGDASFMSVVERVWASRGAYPAHASMACVAGVFPALLLRQPTYQLRAPALFVEAAVQQLFSATSAGAGAGGDRLSELVGALVATLRAHAELLPSLVREHALATRLADAISYCGGSPPLALACFQLLRAAVTDRAFGARFAVAFLSEGASRPSGSWLAAWSLVLERLSQSDSAEGGGRGAGLMLCLMTVRELIDALETTAIRIDAPADARAAFARLALLALDGRVVETLLSLIGAGAAAAPALCAHVIAALQGLARAPEHGASVQALLDACPHWAQFQGQRHDLLEVTDTELPKLLAS